MKPRYLLLAAGIFACVAAITVVMVKGTPQNKVSLDSVMEIGEGLAHSVHRAGGLLTSVSDAEEMEIGDTIHREAFGVKDAKPLEASPLGRYVNAVGARIAEHVKRKGIRYSFHIVDDDLPNARALPGGHIYVTVGLLMTMRTEAELAGVMAHEIAHVDAKHCIGLVGKSAQAAAGPGMLMRLAYSEAQESEADAGSVYLLYEAGYHPYGLVYAFERIDKGGDVPRGSLTPVGDTLKAVRGMVGRYFGTHPKALDRIDKVKRYIDEHGLVTPERRFYVGQRNYDEKAAYSQKRYPDEFRHDYPAIGPRAKETALAGGVATAASAGLLDELYTAKGRIGKGMTVEEVERILPAALQVFKREDRIGYKGIAFYDIRENGKTETAGILIEVLSGVVTGVKIVRDS